MAVNYTVLDDELMDLVSRVPKTEGSDAIECIHFNYPFAILIFDENMNLLQLVGVHHDAEFVELLEGLDENHSISLNYPISGTPGNGELIEINNNEELKQAIKACLKEELLGRCNNTLIDCSWQIVEVNGGDPVYLEQWFGIDYLGLVRLHVEDKVYFGNWVTLFIGDQLYLNIDLNDQEDVELFWDGNWEVHLINDETISISKEGVEVHIVKDCTISCETGVYQQCELDSSPGTAVFNLNDFTTCLGAPADHNLTDSVVYSFHESLEEAEEGVNALEATEYYNTENPQFIYSRAIYANTGDLLEISELTIEAVPCN